ncbi:hypothetical protein BT63DRAFT_243715 [Microthyrium microscopicum]|uniref:Uncharacterized protein n=1 Tax=Microthyrium microscopicum TaxID=703497 RepID=A0A6A6UHR5_9PEZI|nr:hypothetical protein BT63DRAFT_243715 [Microthyrium microscopicum]
MTKHTCVSKRYGSQISSAADCKADLIHSVRNQHANHAQLLATLISIYHHATSWRYLLANARKS